MQAEWNAQKIADMSEEANLRNRCRQIEQEYVDWSRNATYKGFCISREWPAIGELGRYTVTGVKVRFMTTKKRTIQVQDNSGKTVCEVPMVKGMAETLYLTAGTIVDSEHSEPSDHCQANGDPCVCRDCATLETNVAS